MRATVQRSQRFSMRCARVAIAVGIAAHAAHAMAAEEKQPGATTQARPAYAAAPARANFGNYRRLATL